MDSLRYGAVNIVVSMGFNLLFMLFFSSLFLTRKVALMTFMLSCFYQIFYKWISVKHLRSEERVLLIVASGEEATQLAPLLTGVKDLTRYEVVLDIISEGDQLLYQQFCQDPLSFLKLYKIDSVVIENDKMSDELESILFKIKMQGIKIQNALALYEHLHGKMNIRAVDIKWFLYYSGFEQLHSSIYQKVKRGLDIALALTILFFTAPILLLTALAIRLESKGPILFKQERIGLNNVPFTIYKLRSMCQDAEKEGVKWATVNDARVTRVGRWIRKLRIDELPQCFNILKGEMSFVGPRPERLFFIEQLKKEIPFYDVRHFVKPGVTGWAQIKYSYGSSVSDAEEKLKYDLYYIKHAGFLVDVAILLATIKTVITFRGQ